jgi:tetrahydromethanopterin S-methyltransferase subunit C
VNFYVQQPFDNTWGDASGVSTNGMATFLMYDFSPSGLNAGAYATEANVTWTGTDTFKTPAFGPSSGHPAICVVGLGDGSVTALSKRTDAANFFFLITKNNNDPFYIP